MSDSALPGCMPIQLDTVVPDYPAKSRAKRALDLSVALIAVLLFLPLLVLVAVAIRLESSGPILFRQRRTGLGGREITVLKFRTMKVMEDGEAIVQASRGDPRVTRVGYFLRRSSIDELPQLINVLRGNMSLVGPRPHAIAHDTFYQSQIRTYSERFRAKPGITGLAQVNGLRGECATVEAMERRVERDLEYINDWSIGRDFLIIAKTIAVVPFQATAYGLIASALALSSFALERPAGGLSAALL
jgi:exopolysaccharide biosynthesis polyprenyl glycosylphosphotransferase